VTRIMSSTAGVAFFLVYLVLVDTRVLADTNSAALLGASVNDLQAAPNQADLVVPGTIGRLGTAAKSGLRSNDLGTYSKALDALPTGKGPQLRGAREVAIYAQVSPSVVLILNGNTLGSGTLLDSTGLIVTNWHVVARASTVGVIFKPAAEGAPLSKAQVVQGRVIRFDQVTDLALVQVPFIPPQAHPSRLAAATGLQVGDDVHAIGHPTGEAWTYTRGIVSQIRRDYKWNTEEQLQHRADVVQTQTPINPGNSGGPLLNNDGDIVGVNSFKGEGEGLNFAVSSNAVSALLNAQTSRTALAVPAVAKTSAAAKCGPKLVKKWRMTDPPGEATSFDANCTGVVDMIIEYPDDKSQPAAVLLDTKHKGKVDTILFYKDRNSEHPDYALYDTTGAGKPDLIGYFHNNEDEPYRVEKYSP
jgi:S1-C subfamily serine protease